VKAPIACAMPLALIIAASPVAAQGRDAASTAPTTAAISGAVVTAGQTPRPVRRAVVTLNSADPRIGHTAVTDDNGRFTFVNLPPARYSLTATKQGWVPSSYGAKAIGRPGRALQVAPGERANVTISMSRAAVITGTVLDQFGQPLTGVSVRVMKYSYAAATGDRRLSPVFASASGPDERGAFRIFGLPPGEYYVAAENPSTSFMAAGRDLHLTSDVDVQEALSAAQAGPAVPAADVPQSTVSFSQIFYPGTPSVAQATPISLAAGEERGGVDFAVTYSPMARVEGTVVAPDGTPAVARLNLVINDPNGGTLGIQGIRGAQSDADGHFAFAEVPPGAYVLTAVTSLPAAAPEERPRVLSGAAELDVSSNLSGVSVTLQEGVTVSGVLRFDGTGTPPDFRALRVSLDPVQNPSGITVATTGQAPTTADGRFSLSGVTPGRYRLTVSRPSPQLPWILRSAVILGQDAVDVPIDVRQNTADAVVTLTDRLSDLTGKVENAGATDYTMILYSADRAHWFPRSRRVITARTAMDGAFSFRNVPPGEYLLAPVEDVEPGEWYDPAFLQRLAPGALHVTILEGEKKVQNVRIGG
jgi:protocatechuate 3,4-dioxygenase beta subunit